MSVSSERALWCEVLMMAITDATNGICEAPTQAARISAVERARRFLTNPNADFNELCYLAGVDPQATRERLVKQITQAPDPDTLASRDGRSHHRRSSRSRKYKEHGRPGVVSNFKATNGTGDGTAAQDRPKIEFEGSN